MDMYQGRFYESGGFRLHTSCNTTVDMSENHVAYLRDCFIVNPELQRAGSRPLRRPQSQRFRADIAVKRFCGFAGNACSLAMLSSKRFGPRFALRRTMCLIAETTYLV